MTEFANKEFFLLLLLIPVLLYWYWRKHNSSQSELQMSSLEGFELVASQSVLPPLRHLLFVLRLIAIVLFIIALARPQSSTSWQEVKTEGIDIVLALDISGSMLARDFKPDRLEAAKEDAIEFIEARPDDRIGLVVFSGESFTQCPLTSDHAVLKNLFKDLKSGMLKDGTAIGMGLGTAINRLRGSEAKSKVVILLTDGVNNAGDLSPLTAAKLAQAENIRVYTIGVGTIGQAPFPYQDIFGNIQYEMQEVKIDEDMMKSIAEATGGKYFRANNNDRLKEIYKEIDQLEKTKTNSTEFRKRSEQFFWYAFFGCLMILLELLMRYTLFRSVP
jgi:Ca-activated chloride channel family protein